MFVLRNVVGHTNEEYRRKVLETKVLGRIFGPKSEDVTEFWKGRKPEGKRRLR
jgi:hypothetical protein